MIHLHFALPLLMLLCAHELALKKQTSSFQINKTAGHSQSISYQRHAMARSRSPTRPPHLQRRHADQPPHHYRDMTPRTLTMIAWSHRIRNNWYLRQTMKFINCIIMALVIVIPVLPESIEDRLRTAEYAEWNGQPADFYDPHFCRTTLRHSQTPWAQLLWLLSETRRLLIGISNDDIYQIQNWASSVHDYVLHWLEISTMNTSNPPVMDYHYLTAFLDTIMRKQTCFYVQMYNQRLDLPTYTNHVFANPPSHPEAIAYRTLIERVQTW